MTNIALFEVSGDSSELEQELLELNPQYFISRMATTDSGWNRPGNADIGLIVATNGANESLKAAAVITRDLSLPTVVLLPSPGLFDLDVSGSIYELAFHPCSPEEIEIRIQAAIERSGGAKNVNRITNGELAMDIERYEVTIANKRVDLTFKEYELLKVLVANPGRVFSREALLREVWEYDYFGGTRTVDVHVRRVRAKTNDARYHFIETVRNVGYRFRAAS
ncbi:MAG: response regulator transcription factor [Chloroflexi bacterium]|nr:response regulator transcription factor [Chloroflexota bacterium]